MALLRPDVLSASEPQVQRAKEEVKRKQEDLVPPYGGVAGAATAVALLSSFLFGYSICVLDSCGELIPVVFRWCNSDWEEDCLASRVCQGLVNATVYMGAALGSLCVGTPRLSAVGSRQQMMLSDVLWVLGAYLCASAQDLVSLLAGRFASGVGLGICAIAAPLYIAEVSPRERRGANATKHGVFIAVGILASIMLGLPQSPPPQGPQDRLSERDVWFWRFLLAMPAVPALIQALLFKFLVPVDPPSFLVQQGDVAEARSLLYKTYGKLPLAEGARGAGQSTRLELQLNELVEASVSFKTIPRIKIFQAICDPFLRCALVLGFGLAALQQLCGINALMSYSNSLFSEAGIPPDELTMASTAMAAVNVLVSLASSKVVDHWGRRKLLLTGSALQALSMAVITWSSRLLPQCRLTGLITVTSFTVFVVSFSAGLGAVTWLYLSEIYPMEIRGAALSACGVINWMSCFIVVFAARFMGLHASCKTFGIISFVGFAGIYLWVIETKGCSMDDSPLSPLTPRSARSTSSLLTPTEVKEQEVLSH